VVSEKRGVPGGIGPRKKGYKGEISKHKCGVTAIKGAMKVCENELGTPLVAGRFKGGLSEASFGKR